MTDSPDGREIKYIDGDADAIIARAKDIISLGNQMIGSAGVLKEIANGASGMEGLSVKKIEEVVGEVHVELELAGQRYRPTGWALKTYGTTLDQVQSGEGDGTLRTIIDNCEEYWQAYQAAAGAYDDANKPFQPPADAPDPEPGAGPSQAEQDHDQAIDDAKKARDDAYEKWKAEADKFDDRYDTWIAAFNKAVEDIGEATDGGIQDNWNDDLAGTFDTVLQVLTVVGVIVAVLVIVIGGPILAIIATAIALATFALTAFNWLNGYAEGSDMIWATIGIIPFGKLGAFAKGGSEGMEAFGKGFLALDEFGDARNLFRNGFNQSGLTGAVDFLYNSRNGFTNLFRGSFRPVVGGDILGRWMGLQNASELNLAGTGQHMHHTINLITGHFGENVIKGVTSNSVGISGLFDSNSSKVDSWQAELDRNRN